MTGVDAHDDARLTTPDLWARSMSRAAPVVSSDRAGWGSGLVRRWTGGSGMISQPPIDHHYVVLHLGGPKHVTRVGAGRTLATPVQEGALTLVPAGTRYEWMTVGPIDFAHLYVPPAQLNNLIAHKFDRDPTSVTLDERVGFEDPLLAHVIREMLAKAQAGDPAEAPYLDALYDVALATLAHKHSTLGPVPLPSRLALAPGRLRRVLDQVEDAIAERISLADLAGAAGLSRFHFARAFQAAMGEPPMAYVARRRLELAKRLLRDSELALAEIARSAGYGTPSQFADTFKRRTGRTPSDYRRRF